MISVLLLLFIYFLLKRVGHILEYKPITRDTCQKHDSSEEERCGVAAVWISRLSSERALLNRRLSFYLEGNIRPIFDQILTGQLWHGVENTRDNGKQ